MHILNIERKTCSRCKSSYTREEYSGNQWRKPAHSRRCSDCVDDANFTKEIWRDGYAHNYGFEP